MGGKSDMNVSKKLQEEITSMQGLWHGGTTLSTRGFEVTAGMRFGGDLHCDLKKIEELCVKPYVSDAVALDIGTNGGGWLLRMVPEAKECHGIDIQTAEHTGFWKHIPEKYHNKTKYHQASDFSCSGIEDDSLDFVFSHDVFCHISFSGAVAYLESLYNKCKSGANLMIAIADSDKYTSESGKKKLMRRAGFNNWESFVQDHDGEPIAGRWYFYGPDMLSKEAERIGFEVVSKDIVGEHDRTLAMVHFRKPTDK